MKKTLECNSCSCEATIDFNFDEIGQEPLFCPFCGEPYINEELDELEYPHDNSMDDEW